MDKTWIKWAIGVVLAIAFFLGGQATGNRHGEREKDKQISELNTKIKELEEKKNVRFSRDQCDTARNICGFSSRRVRRRSND